MHHRQGQDFLTWMTCFTKTYPVVQSCFPSLTLSWWKPGGQVFAHRIWLSTARISDVGPPSIGPPPAGRTIKDKFNVDPGWQSKEAMATQSLHSSVSLDLWPPGPDMWALPLHSTHLLIGLPSPSETRPYSETLKTEYLSTCLPVVNSYNSCSVFKT